MYFYTEIGAYQIEYKIAQALVGVDDAKMGALGNKFAEWKIKLVVLGRFSEARGRRRAGRTGPGPVACSRLACANRLNLCRLKSSCTYPILDNVIVIIILPVLVLSNHRIKYANV